MAEIEENSQKRIAVDLKLAQVNRLQRLMQSAREQKTSADTAEQKVTVYIQGIADAHGVNGCENIELELEKKRLVFLQEKK